MPACPAPKRLQNPLHSTLCGLVLLVAHAGAAAFGFDDVTELARRNAATPWVEPRPDASPALQALGYDVLRDIRFRPERALWRAQGLPFELQFFHLGGGHRVSVPMHELHDGRVRALPYEPSAWKTGKLSGGSPLAAPGHAGFRVHHALNDAAYKDELIVFLGASYFRAVGRGQLYGLSARALALDTVGGRGGEEFPTFKGFWFERPAPDARALTIHALLDSRRATGAYRFTVRPGEQTVVDVQARLFERQALADNRPELAPQRCLAPLTSMYLHGENQPRPGDFRPEVHDSDGLLMALAPRAGAEPEWLWRPLVNPRQAQVSTFTAARLHGFGLMQRDRRLAAYEDTEAHYERRPSAWVEPLGDWGPGRVQLLLLPAGTEAEDNVVACWVPDASPTPGRTTELAWRLHWQGDTLTTPPNGWTVQTRRGHGWTATPRAADELQFVVDFDGPALRALPAGARVTPIVSAPANGRITEVLSHPHPQGGWRMHLRVQRPDPVQPTELRAFLQHGAHALTETWTALIPPD